MTEPNEIIVTSLNEAQVTAMIERTGQSRDDFTIITDVKELPEVETTRECTFFLRPSPVQPAIEQGIVREPSNRHERRKRKAVR